MRATEIIEHVRKQPFEPFTVCVTDGTSHDVPHPEMILVTRTVVAIAIAGDGGIPEEMVYCDPGHVTQLAPLRKRPPSRRPKRED